VVTGRNDRLGVATPSLALTQTRGRPLRAVAPAAPWALLGRNYREEQKRPTRERRALAIRSGLESRQGHLISARLPPPTDLQYAERETAERDAEIYRQENARDVEATKRRPKYKTEPATYTVVSVDPAPAP
jgi:hypothetical protein